MELFGISRGKDHMDNKYIRRERREHAQMKASLNLPLGIEGLDTPKRSTRVHEWANLCRIIKKEESINNEQIVGKTKHNSKECCIGGHICLILH
jgi:hypothetical protein